MSFARMRARAAHLLPIVYEHPFNRELAQGTLSKDVFRYYLEQDSLYLKDFSEALKITSQRFVNQQHAKKLTEFSEKALVTERNLHAKYLGEFRQAGLFEQKKNLEKNFVVSTYTHHLLHAATELTVEEALASLIPCFWLYNELGQMMMQARRHEHNPYQLWLSSYSSKHFTESVQSMIRIFEELATPVLCPHKNEKIDAAFIKSIKYEILFWDSVTLPMAPTVSLHY